jgi:hypothetical protein
MIDWIGIFQSGNALVNAAMHSRRTATHKGIRPKALKTAHTVEARRIATSRYNSNMRLRLRFRQEPSVGRELSRATALLDLDQYCKLKRVPHRTEPRRADLRTARFRRNPFQATRDAMRSATSARRSSRSRPRHNCVRITSSPYEQAQLEPGCHIVRELGKDIVRATLPIVETRSGKKVEYQDDETRKSASK